MNTRWFISAVVITDLCIELPSAITTRLVQTGEHDLQFVSSRAVKNIVQKTVQERIAPDQPNAKKN